MNLEKLDNAGLRIKKKWKKKITFMAGCVVGDNLYFSSWIDNGFYRMDIRTGKCTLLDLFRGEKEHSRLYKEAISYKNSIWFIPSHVGQFLVKVNLDTLEMKYINLPEEGREIRDRLGNYYPRFKCCYREGKSEFWLVPIGYNMLLKIDMETDKIMHYDELQQNLTFEDGIINFNDACFIGNEIWICPRESKKLVIFNTITEKFTYSKWDYHDSDEFGIVKEYKNFAAFIPIDKAKSILLIEKESLKSREVLINAKTKRSDRFNHFVANIVEEWVLIAPFLSNELIAVNLETGKVEINTKLHNYIEQMEWGAERYQTSFRYDSKIIFVSDMPDMPLMVLDLANDKVFYMEISVDKRQYISFFINLYYSNTEYFINWANKRFDNKYIEEDCPIDLYPFFINSANTRSKNQSSKEVGKQIFEAVK